MRELIKTEAFTMLMTACVEDLKTAKKLAHEAKKQQRSLLKTADKELSKQDRKALKVAFEQAKISYLTLKAAFQAAKKVASPYLIIEKKVKKKVEKTVEKTAKKAKKESAHAGLDSENPSPKAAKKSTAAKARRTKKTTKTVNTAPQKGHTTDGVAKKRVAKAKAVGVQIVERVQTHKADDLTIIEGIGPKTEALLKAEGIATFEQLLQTTPEHLQAILDKAGSRFKMHNPAAWQEQGQLAKTEQWDALQILQKVLKGGVRS